MADNLAPEAVVSAAAFKFAMAETTFGGDTVYVSGSFLGIIAGVEGSRTFAPIVAGAGSVDGGTQRMTLAADDPGVVSLAAIKTAVETIDNAISGNEMQVDIISSATLTVTGTGGTFPVTDSGGSLTVDAPVGTPVFVRLSDGSAAIATLPVSLASVPSHAVTNAGTFPVQVDGSALTALQLIDDVIGATGAAVPAKAALIGGWDGTNIEAAFLTPNTTVQGGNFSFAGGNSWVVCSLPSIWNGSAWNPLPGSATDGVTVNLGTNNDVTVTGTVSGTGTAGTAATGVVTVQGIASMTPLLVTAQASTNTQEVVGDAAHGAAVAGNPLLIGLEGRSTDGTAVDSGDVVRGLASLLGKQVVMPHALPGSGWDYAAVSGGITDTADDVARAAQGVGTRNYITGIQVINGHATVSTEVVVKSASTVIWRGWAQAAGGGCAFNGSKPLLGGDNEAINVTNVTTGSATYFNLQGYSAAE